MNIYSDRINPAKFKIANEEICDLFKRMNNEIFQLFFSHKDAVLIKKFLDFGVSMFTFEHDLNDEG